jgi:hypothetical protein
VPSFSTPSGDESTFIIVGQGILDGFLPYTKLWDFKPPFVFCFFAGAIAMFGKSVAAIRFAGCLWLAVASYLLFLCVLALTNNKLQSFATAMLAATVISLSTPYVSSELLALTPLIAAQLVLLQHNEKLTKFYTCGLLIAIGGMFRSNVLYVSIFVGIYIALFRFTYRSPRIAAARVSAYIAGGFTVLVVGSVPYVITGQVDIWFRSVFLAPWHFSTTELSTSHVPELVIKGLRMTYSQAHVTGILVGVVLWFGGATGMMLGLLSRSRIIAPNPNSVFAVLWFVGGILMSISLTGTSHRGYLVLVVPWFAMCAAIGLNLVPRSNIRSMICKGILILVLTHGIFSVAMAYSDLSNRLLKNENIFSGPEIQLAAFLRHENVEKRPIYLLDLHIVYWLMGQYPLTRMSTHPSNITKQALIETIEGAKSTPEGEMEKILAVPPEFIIKPSEEIWYLQSAPKASEVLNQALEHEYDFVGMVGEREIYRKTKKRAHGTSP